MREGLGRDLEDALWNACEATDLNDLAALKLLVALCLAPFDEGLPVAVHFDAP